MSYAARRYQTNDLNTSVIDASPHELIILVYKKIFDHLRMGKKEIQNGKYGIESFTKAQELINHGLLATLDYKNGGEIAQNLKVLYEWSLTELILARVGRSEEKVQSVIDVLTNLYEGWCSMNPSASN